MRRAALCALLCVGCGAPDGDPLRLTVGAARSPLAAWYSIFVEPLADGPTIDALLVVTFVEKSFRCGELTDGLDALSVSWEPGTPGATSATVLGRAGPHLAAATGARGTATLRTVDARYQGFDAPAIHVAPGGRVTGAVRLAFDGGDGGGIAVDGDFDAPHCAALDFVATP